jgi:Fe-S cluster assembly ATPase SufC
VTDRLQTEKLVPQPQAAVAFGFLILNDALIRSSTLAYVLAGKTDYQVTAGEVLFDGEDLLAMQPDERAARGVFLAFQYPMEIPGVAVRAGTHCVMPLLARYGVTATCRASFALYNTKDEVDTLAESMVKAREFFA